MSDLREVIRRLQRDAGERAQLIQAIVWLAPVAWIALWLVLRVARDRGQISATAYPRLLWVAVPVAVLLAMAAARLFRLMSEGLVHATLGGGTGGPRPPTYSLEESLVARGDYAGAAQALTARLGTGEDDAELHLRLAEIQSRWLHDDRVAETELLAARRTPASDRQRAAIANALLDLYRRTGQRGRLMAELARFADAWPASRAAKDARRELQRLKEEGG